ncbi:hypothetical protein [Methanolobus sp.]|uniref:hypothetical protein n=1 Tax=Methanolobus sp. TaxID=1874737 RepID=UPI0025E5032C|nr:hypothetical protein [Methanolobus sp.]
MKTNTKTLESKFEDFKKDVLAEYQETTHKFQEEVKEKEFMKGLKSLADTLPDIENLPITKTNADTVVNVFKLLDRFQKNPDTYTTKWDELAVELAGKEHGFDKKMSYSLFYMARYAKAHERLTSKKTELYQVITGVNL